MLARSAPESRAVYLLAYDLALRACEVARVRGRDVDWRRREVRSPRSKGGRVFVLGVSIVTLKAIRPFAVRAGKAVTGPLFPKWTPRRFRDAFRRDAARIGLPVDDDDARCGQSKGKGYSHILRRSRATHLLEAGAKLKDVQWRLGHASPRTTLLYLGLTEGRQREVNRMAAGLIDDLDIDGRSQERPR